MLLEVTQAYTFATPCLPSHIEQYIKTVSNLIQHLIFNNLIYSKFNYLQTCSKDFFISCLLATLSSSTQYGHKK